MGAELIDVASRRFLSNEWSEAFEGFFSQIPLRKWMNHPSRNSLSSSKLNQLVVAKRLGILIPDTLVTRSAAELREFFLRNDGKVVTKPMSSALLERDEPASSTLIYTNRVLESHLGDLNDLVNCPTMFQSEIVKVSDLRITIVDGAIHAVELVSLDQDGKQLCDIRRDNMNGVRYRVVTLPQDLQDKLMRLLEYFNLRFAAIDMAVDVNGNYVFFEVNPNGQWAWLDLAGATDICSSLVASFSSANL